MNRWAWAEIDLSAVRHNIQVLRGAVAPSGVWAVVKANAYGHGAIEVARVASEEGVGGLCVALAQEGIELRHAGIALPILVLSEQPHEQFADMVACTLTPTLYTSESIIEFGRLAGPMYPIHIKIDTGMHRVGAPSGSLARLLAVARQAGLKVVGVFTHLAVSDELDNPYNAQQLAEFSDATKGLDLALHAGNSAAALSLVSSHLAFVRCGIALFGLSPSPELDASCRELRPALSLRARAGFVKRLTTGDRLSYGLHHEFAQPTTVITVPIGYADGVPRRLGPAGGQVLVQGQRCPIVGSVTMDQIMIDAGDLCVDVGDEIVLIGHQGDGCITVDDWATWLGTINYEVVCGITPRVPRVYRDTKR